MSIATIEAAILAHQTWVSRFQTALRGINNESFDIASASDDAACVLGQWLQLEHAEALLGSEKHQQIQAIHTTFHEIAGMIAGRLNHQETGKEIEEWVADFNSLSRQLISLLILAKRGM